MDTATKILHYRAQPAAAQAAGTRRLNVPLFTLRFYAVFAGLFGGLACLTAQDNWKFRTEQNGIKVYSSQQESSAFNALRATFEADATLSQYAAAVLDIDQYKRWNSAVYNPYIVKRINESELVYYSEAKAPWPVQDRYVVLHLKVTQDPASKTLTIRLKNLPDVIPQKKGFIRIKEYHANITVTPLSSTRVKVEYVARIDPGGSIPAWIANLLMDELPVKSFTQLKARLNEMGDQSEAVPFIDDK